MEVFNSAKPVYVKCFTSWAPGLNAFSDWKEWAFGNRQIESNTDSPSLDISESPHLNLDSKEFSLFKRRLSRISRMTIHVLHELIKMDPLSSKNAKIVFVSFRGEITQQFKINRMLAEDGDVSPAAFSNSVFNTPAAAAAIALGLTAGYCAIYPAKDRFDTGLLAAVSPILSAKTSAANEAESILVYADELCPAEYGNLCPQPNEPLAFAAVLSTQESGIKINDDACTNTPRDFLKFLYTKMEMSP